MVDSLMNFDVDLQIFDARGVLVKIEKVSLYKGMNTTKLDISDLSDGMYIIRVPQVEGDFSTQRFVKVGG